MTDADRTQLAKDLIEDEGTGPVVRGRFLPYRDSVGKLTIGYGRNLDDRGISKAEAHYLLLEDIQLVIEEMHALYPWARMMNPVRQRVLANMLYNLGATRLSTFVHTLKAMREGRYADAAEGMRESKWAAQVKGRATRLALQMETGTI